MDEMTAAESAAFDALLAADAAGDAAWLTRVHRQLQQRWPDDCVVRYDDPLDDLLDWLDAEGVEACGRDAFFRIDYDDDWGAARPAAEGGRIAFRWRGWQFRIFSVRALEGRWF